MTSINRFRQDNTEGYSDADLATLNLDFLDACAAEDVDPVDGDKSHLDHIAERVLAAYDDDKWVRDLTVGSRVEGGDNAEDYDTGRVTHIAGDEITVSWDSGTRTTQPSSILRPEGSNPHPGGHLRDEA